VLTKVLGQRCYYVPNDPQHDVEMLDHDGARDAEPPGP
jgi:hypothetical protein